MPVLSLSIGSNIEPARHIRLALQALREKFPNLRCSRVYESEAIGFDGANFLNLAVVADTSLELAEISSYLKGIEDGLGRDRRQPKFSGRSMDIDILTFGADTGASCNVQLPRPEITRNAFVLQPLAELLPEQLDPACGKTYRQLWSEFDKSSQRLWPVEFDWLDSTA